MKNFIRKIEDFECEHCGEKVVGDGYTDHCPKCLWGKHVDDQIPGDRASQCKSLMEPVETSYEKGDFRIHHMCTKCKHEFWVWCDDNDSRDELIRLAGYK